MCSNIKERCSTYLFEHDVQYVSLTPKQERRIQNLKLKKKKSNILKINYYITTNKISTGVLFLNNLEQDRMMQLSFKTVQRTKRLCLGVGGRWGMRMELIRHFFFFFYKEAMFKLRSVGLMSSLGKTSSRYNELPHRFCLLILLAQM